MLFCESEAEPAARSRAMTARMPEHTEEMDASAAHGAARRFFCVSSASRLRM